MVSRFPCRLISSLTVYGRVGEKTDGAEIRKKFLHLRRTVEPHTS